MHSVDKAYSNTHFILPRTYEAEITEFHKKRRTAYISLCYADRCAEIAYITVYTYAYAYETMYTVSALYLVPQSHLYALDHFLPYFIEIPVNPRTRLPSLLILLVYLILYLSWYAINHRINASRLISSSALSTHHCR